MVTKMSQYAPIEEIFTLNIGIYNLIANSIPSGIPFVIDMLQPQTTPFTLPLTEGTHTVTTPNQVVINNKTYNFEKWEDNSILLSRTINLIADSTITATYAEQPVTPCSTNQDCPTGQICQDGQCITVTPPIDFSLIILASLIGATILISTVVATEK